VARVEGYSLETVFPTGFRTGGGTQLQHGVFSQVTAKAGIAQLQVGLRHHFTGNGQRFWSPSGGVTVGRGSFRGRASAYRSFRAPTLNELYRDFRAGIAVTQANPLLEPETLLGVEAGGDWVGETRRLGVTFFRNSIEQIITNVTLVNTPAQIIRQRRNAAEAVSRGFEMELRQRLSVVHAEFSYLFAESRFGGGGRLPQIPKHQGSAQISYAKNGTLLTSGMRSYGLQFEDDRNTQVLPGYAVFHVTAQQRLPAHLTATFALENAFDRAFAVGFSAPFQNLGAPRMWRAGLRWDIFGR
jgi:outer membrane receptor protein involved in Fe transport